MFNDQEQDFLNAHRWATLTHLRSSGQPVSSVVAYARDDGQFVVSTPGQTFKRHGIDRDGRVNLCIISNAEPFNFIAIEGLASITRDDLESRTRAVFANIAGTGYELPPDLPGWLEQQQRVIVLITAQRHHTVIR